MSEVTFRSLGTTGYGTLRCETCGATLRYYAAEDGTTEMRDIMERHTRWHTDIGDGPSAAGIWAIVVLLLVGWGAFLLFTLALVNGWPK